MTSVPVPPWRAERKKAPRRSLSREAIVTAALHVVDAEGLDALSMRRVAQELDTGAASLYAHVANKEELLELLLDRIQAGVTRPEPDPERWQEQVKELARQGRRVLVAHRDLARAAIGQGIPFGPNALLNAEAMLAILKAGGLSDQVCAYGVDALALFVTATAVEESLRGQGLGESGVTLDEQVVRIREYFRSLPPEGFPHITGMVDALMRDEGDERFEFGLDLLVSGLARHAPA
ncbi:TetR/AcrR family transcriptional regulator C-terminal domain-containing protein [Actinacidiphila glaucinigra]|uniref:TetR/AcrR family transcriptional regulator n=1 Tax=Actinacidiphila glaucinigra TaxID=235986 RepID=UPI003401AF10